MNNKCNHGIYYCHDNSNEELVYTVPIHRSMSWPLLNQSEDDDHSGGQKETRGSRLCYVMWLIKLIL